MNVWGSGRYYIPELLSQNKKEININRILKLTVLQPETLEFSLGIYPSGPIKAVYGLRLWFL